MHILFGDNLELVQASLRKSFVWNFKELFRQGALYRALPTALVGAVPKAVIHYSILNFYINSFAPEGDIKKADGQTATVIGSWAECHKLFHPLPPCVCENVLKICTIGLDILDHLKVYKCHHPNPRTCTSD